MIDKPPFVLGNSLDLRRRFFAPSRSFRSFYVLLQTCCDTKSDGIQD